MKRPPRRPWFAFGAIASLATIGAVSTAAGSITSGCAQQPVQVPLRSLERSGAVSYICLSVPGDPAGVLHTVDDCASAITIDPQTFALDDAGTLLVPHLYAMVTQTTRGEVAVVDITAQDNSVIDENPGIPGANFLPIGAQPVDIVSTPGSTATFVGVAEVARPGIFALPSAIVRPSSLLEDGGIAPEPLRAVPALSSWPACSLPAAPGKMMLVSDPAVNGAVRARCDDGYAEVPPAGPNGDLGLETNVDGTKGRFKLLVAMPDMGGFVVIDAQTLLDRDPGSFDPCPVDRWVPLDVDLPMSSTPPPNEDGPACVWPSPSGPNFAGTFVPRPAAMSYTDASEPHHLYIGDLQAPLIHVIDLPTPCEPVEDAPLVPTSIAQPYRTITSDKVAVGPLTRNLKQFLYAVDHFDASMMVFDVSQPAPGKPPPSRYPIQRPHPEWDPFTPADRVRLPAPVADLMLLEHDPAQPLLTTGVAEYGAICSPLPQYSCPLNGDHCDVEAIYRTDATFDNGAGPLKLRGQFVFAALTNGRIAIVDVDDFDEECRVPTSFSPLYGCPPSFEPDAHAENPILLQSSAEESCNIVTPHTPRDSLYTAADPNAGFHGAGVQILPRLYDINGTVVTDPDAPRMVATVPYKTCSEGRNQQSPCTKDEDCDPHAHCIETAAPLTIAIGGTPVVIDKSSGVYTDPTAGVQNTLAMNLEDPRAQIADQAWTVTYEGLLPGFSQKLGVLQINGTPNDGLYDGDGQFCEFGVHSQHAVYDALKAAGSTTKHCAKSEPTASAAVCKTAADCIDPKTKDDDGPCKEDALEDSKDLADYVQIFSELPVETDPYWGVADPVACDFASCNTTFGTIETPAEGRDLRIVEAFDDHVLLVKRSDGKAVDGALTNCCFPPPINYNVRIGKQWAVVGQSTGFPHHVIPDPTTGVCRDSCDPFLQRLNGRVTPVPRGVTLPIVDASNDYAFINPMFRFAVLACPSPPPEPCPPGQRDEQFQFSSQGAFQPLLVNLAPDATTLMQPVGLTFIPSTSELEVTDGTIQGLTLVQVGSVTVSRRFY